MIRFLLVGPLLVLGMGLAHAEPPKTQDALKGLDPVELVAGREVPGQAELSIVRGLYRYQFSNAANKVAFEKEPDRFAVQFGGVCMKMGPLSGQGSPDRYFVHANRIYLFASESCRNTFKAAPEKYIDTPDAPPVGTEAEKKRGQELLDRMLTGLGGAKAVDAVTGIETKYGLSYPQKDKAPFLMTRVVTLSFPARFREEDSYTGWSGLAVTDGATGFQTSGKLAWPIEDSVRTFIVRRMSRDPLTIAKARNEAGFVAVASGRGKVGDGEVEWLTVGVRGATTTLGLDATGRAVQLKYKDRAGGSLGEVTKTFSDFRVVGGVTLPHAVAVSYDGKPVANPATTIEAITVNPTLNEKRFTMPD